MIEAEVAEQAKVVVEAIGTVLVDIRAWMTMALALLDMTALVILALEEVVLAVETWL